jgi:hypothetical protein
MNIACWSVEINSSDVEDQEAVGRRVKAASKTLSVELSDGRTIAAPLA